ncbi:MAG TPA: RagB/SusD family nutrient uptake outer membrane protein [Prevotella sp.]
MKKKLLYILPLLGGLLVGCNGFLDEESQSEVIPKTASDFSELLMGSAYPDNNAPDMSWVSFLDDDCSAYLDLTGYDASWQPIDGFAGENATITPLPYYSWQPYMMDQNGFGEKINTTASATTYAQFYQKIMGCNAVLDGIDNALGTQESRNRVKAEALAVRSLLYFQLVNLYGQPYNYNKEAPGVPLKLNANLNKKGITRSTVAQVYENVIVPDLQQAALLMDPLPVITKNYRVNQPAIHILLSRVFLFMERYQDCINEAQKALAFDVRLMDLKTELDQSKMFSGGFNPYDYTNPEVLWIFGPGMRVNIDNYRPTMGENFSAIWDQQNDLRWVQAGLGNPANNGVMFKPYGNSALCQNIRTAEAYLNKMEAEALLNKAADANADLEAFCQTRYKNYSSQNLSGEKLLQAIRLERRREFCYEGFRWFDLRRQGMPEITHIYRAEKGGPKLKYVLKHNDALYTLPLPSVIFDQNADLVQNESRNAPERVTESAE